MLFSVSFLPVFPIPGTQSIISHILMSLLSRVVSWSSHSASGLAPFCEVLARTMMDPIPSWMSAKQLQIMSRSSAWLATLHRLIMAVAIISTDLTAAEFEALVIISRCSSSLFDIAMNEHCSLFDIAMMSNNQRICKRGLQSVGCCCCCWMQFCWSFVFECLSIVLFFLCIALYCIAYRYLYSASHGVSQTEAFLMDNWSFVSERLSIVLYCIVLYIDIYITLLTV